MTKKSAATKRPLVLTLLLCLFTSFQPFISEGIRAEDESAEPRFSLKFRDMEIREVLTFLADESGRNIVIPEGLTQKVSLGLDDITLEDALDVILKSYGFSYVDEKGVIRVVNVSRNDSELSEEDLVTQIITLNHARSADLEAQVKNVISPRGSVSVDKRSNSLIIKDVKSGIDEAANILKQLDTRASQVLIKARIVEVRNTFSRELGIQWGGRYTSGSGRDASVSGRVGGDNFAVNLPADSPTSGIGMTIGSISSNATLDIQLSAAEERGDVNIVSKPEITTVNNMPARVSSGVEYTIKTTVNTGSATLSEGLEKVKAQTSLDVTPQVSDDGHVLLTIEVTRDEPDWSEITDDIPSIISKNAKTTVLVRDGETTVIGGLYKTVNSNSNRAVPYLSRIPFLGWLFKSKSRSNENEELLIFITPKIIKEFG